VAGTDKPNAQGRVAPGDLTQRVGVEAITARGVDVDQLLEKLVDAAGAEFMTYYYYTILRMYLAGEEDYKEICEDARLEDRAHFELITPRIYELGGTIPYDVRTFADRAGCPDAFLPGQQQRPACGPEPARHRSPPPRRRRSWKCCWKPNAAPSAPGAKCAT